MSQNAAIQVQNLHKDFGDVYAVQGVDFNVRKGEIFSLLGPNGAGKSTTISMIAGLLHPNQGKVKVAGYDIQNEPLAAKAAIGVVPQEIALYEDLSARENLIFWGKMYGLRGVPLKKRVDEASKLYAISKSEIVKRALNKYLLHRELEELRFLLIPHGEKSGFLTDEDVFSEIS